MWLALGDEAALVQHDQPIDDLEQGMYDMLDPNNRDPAAPNILDQCNECDAFRFGQSTCDLVEQQHARTGRERASELEALAVEQRERASRPVGLTCEPA